jgi:hypothetical protein
MPYNNVWKTQSQAINKDNIIYRNAIKIASDSHARMTAYNQQDHQNIDRQIKEVKTLAEF